jgi:hypothetical protein
MQPTKKNSIKNREELKNKRKVLFKLFLKNPMHTNLAVEIKALDDQLADWTHLLARK